MNPTITAAYEAGRAAHHWPPAHVAELQRLVGTHKSWREVAAGMQALRPGIGADACRVRAARLGINLGARGALWTAEEDNALLNAIENVAGWSAVAAHMQAVRPGASRDSVRERARRLGLCDEGEPW